MNSPLFPDVNVWVALNSDLHTHHPAAWQWYEGVPTSATLVFCRADAARTFQYPDHRPRDGAGGSDTTRCWQLYDSWIATGQVALADEPRDLEERLRALTGQATSSPKNGWMPIWLPSQTPAQLTLVTFDRALAGKAAGSVLLACCARPIRAHPILCPRADSRDARTEHHLSRFPSYAKVQL